MKGKLFIVSGPSGVGKTTVVDLLLKEMNNLKRLITCTTREPREGEEHGRDYFFFHRDHFEKLIRTNHFVEWERIHGKYYGILKIYIDGELASGNNLIVIVDVKGKESLKIFYPKAKSIFMIPSKPEDLLERLENRGEKDIAERFGKAIEMMTHKGEYDHILINDNINITKECLKAILH